MAANSHMSFHFGFEFFCNFRIGEDVASSQNEPKPNKIEAPVPQTDLKEADLSPAAQNMQRQIREREQARLKQEREADAESLDLLEAATAASSKEAKIKDNESLELLLRWTRILEKPQYTLKTPAHMSFWPPRYYIKGLDGSPLSYEPSFSTPSAVYREEVRSTGNEFEDFLLSEASSKPKTRSEPKNKKRNSFSELLASSRSSEPKTGTSAIGHSEYITKEVNSVLEIMDKVEQQDADDGLALTEDFIDAVESPVDSPTSHIKHLPGSDDGSVRKSWNAERNAGHAQGEVSALASSNELGAEGESPGDLATPESESEDDSNELRTEGVVPEGIATPESESDESSNGEEWEMV